MLVKKKRIGGRYQLGSICIRNTNFLQTSYINDVIYQQSNLLSSNMMQYDDIFIRNDSMNVNDQQRIVNEDRKWHDDLIYS